MKKLLFFLVLICTNLFSQNSKKHELLIPYRDGNLWGLCDTLGVVKLKPFADEIIDFKINEDFSSKYIVKKKGEISVIDESKNYLLQNSKYDSISIEYFDKAIEVYKNKKIGVFLEGKEFIPCDYDKVHEVHNKSYIVGKGNLFGLINSKGKLIVPIKYEDINFSKEKNGKAKWIATYKAEEKVFYDIDIEDEPNHPPMIGMTQIYDEISNPDSVQLYNQRIQEIQNNYDVNFIVNKKFAIVSKIADSKKQEGESGIIKISDNKIILEVKYNGIAFLENEKGKAFFSFNDRTYGENDNLSIIDEEGKIFLSGLDEIMKYKESIYFIKKDEKWGVKIFNTIYNYIPPKYKSIDLYDSFRINENWKFNLFKVETVNGKKGYVGENGVEYFKD